MAENYGCEYCDDELPEEDYDSGPYCQHWDDPFECEDLCKCGHFCHRHNFVGEDCKEELCKCEKFKDKDDKK